MREAKAHLRPVLLLVVHQMHLGNLQAEGIDVLLSHGPSAIALLRFLPKPRGRLSFQDQLSPNRPTYPEFTQSKSSRLLAIIPPVNYTLCEGMLWLVSFKSPSTQGYWRILVLLFLKKRDNIHVPPELPFSRPKSPGHFDCCLLPAFQLCQPIQFK